MGEADEGNPRSVAVRRDSIGGLGRSQPRKKTVRCNAIDRHLVPRRGPTSSSATGITEIAATVFSCAHTTAPNGQKCRMEIASHKSYAFARSREQDKG